MRKAMTSGWPWSVDDDSYRVDGIGTEKYGEANVEGFAGLQIHTKTRTVYIV